MRQKPLSKEVLSPSWTYVPRGTRTRSLKRAAFFGEDDTSQQATSRGSLERRVSKYLRDLGPVQRPQIARMPLRIPLKRLRSKRMFLNADRIIIDVYTHTYNLYGLNLSDIGETKFQHCLEHLIEKTDLATIEDHLREEFNGYLLDFLISSTHFFIRNGLVERKDGKFAKTDIFDVAWNLWMLPPSSTSDQQPTVAQASNSGVRDTVAVEDKQNFRERLPNLSQSSTAQPPTQHSGVPTSPDAYFSGQQLPQLKLQDESQDLEIGDTAITPENNSSAPRDLSFSSPRTLVGGIASDPPCSDKASKHLTSSSGEMERGPSSLLTSGLTMNTTDSHMSNVRSRQGSNAPIFWIRIQMVDDSGVTISDPVRFPGPEHTTITDFFSWFRQESEIGDEISELLFELPTGVNSKAWRIGKTDKDKYELFIDTIAWEVEKKIEKGIVGANALVMVRVPGL